MRARTMIVAVMIGLAVAGQGRADLYMKQKQHTDAYEMMGQTQAASDLVTEVWIAGDRIASSNPEQGFIVRLDKNITYIIDHKKKTYMEMAADLSNMTPNLGKEESAAFKEMMSGMMKMEVTVTPTGEKKKIGSWACKKYIQKLRMMMGTFDSEVWATQDIQIDEDLYSRYASALYASMPGMQSALESIQKEMKKIKGVSVLTQTTNTVMGKTFKSSTELLDVKEGKAPAEAFELPKGYRKTTMGQQ